MTMRSTLVHPPIVLSSCGAQAFEREALWSDAPSVFKPIPSYRDKAGSIVSDLHGYNDTYYRLPVEVFKSKMDNAIIHKLFSEVNHHLSAAR